jgi:hypothetical protein
MSEHRLHPDVDESHDADAAAEGQREPGAAAVRPTVRLDGQPVRTSERPGRRVDWCVPTRLIAQRGPLANLVTVNELFTDSTTFSYAALHELDAVERLIVHEHTGLRERPAMHHGWLVGKRHDSIQFAAVVDEVPTYAVLCFVELHADKTLAGRRAYTDFARRVERLATSMNYEIYAGVMNENPLHQRFLKSLGMEPFAELYKWSPK